MLYYAILLCAFHPRQKWLAVVSLAQSDGFSESDALRKLARLNKYEIKAVLWNPHVAKQQLMVSTVRNTS